MYSLYYLDLPVVSLRCDCLCVLIILSRFTRSKSSMRLSLCSPEFWTSTSVWMALSFMLYWYRDRWGGYPILSELLRLPGEGTVYPYRQKTKHCHQCTPIEKTHKKQSFLQNTQKTIISTKQSPENALLKQTEEIISSYIEKTCKFIKPKKGRTVKIIIPIERVWGKLSE